MNIVDIQKHTNNTVSKANELIKAKGGLSGTGQKMLSSLISMIRVDDSELQKYALKIDDYLELIGSKSINYEFIKEQAKELMKNPFEIDGLIFNWCSMVDTKEMSGYLIFDIHPRLKPYLLDLKERGNFTQYGIVNILNLKGEYTQRMYEYCILEWNKHKKYNKSAKSYNFELKISWIIEYFNIPKSYKYADIKRRILDKAAKQFKERTDIQISYKEQKIGRKVDRLIITVRENNKGSNDFLVSRKAFIAYIRQAYRPNPSEDNYPTIFRTDTVEIKIDINGKLYAIENGTLKDLTKEKANTWWDFLYEKALTKELPIQQTLF